MCLRWWRRWAGVLIGMGGERGALSDEADCGGDEEDSEPSLPGDVFMKPNGGDKDHDDVAECGGGKDKGEVGPGERGEVAGEEAYEQRDADGDPGSEDGGDESAGMGQGDGWQEGHAALEAGVAEGRAEHDGEQDRVLAGF